MKTWITQLRKGALELLLLNVIARSESYGYEILQQLRRIDDLTVGESTMYPVLERLHRDGYVRVRQEPSPSGPMRRYYSLTTLGECRVGEMNRYWDHLCESIRDLRKAEKGEAHADY